MAKTTSKSKKPASKKTAGRYSEVKSILNEVQGKNVPDYQGLKAFWLDYDTFLSAKMYGQRMIAPGPGDGLDATSESNPKAGAASESNSGSCCGSESEQNQSTGCWPSGGSSGGSGGGSGGGKDTSRSEQSGIIKGLRGQAPFDGSVFPALLWDAKRSATDAEISTIADWIDDGCPQDDTEVSTQKETLRLQASRLVALACGEMKHSVAEKPTNKMQRSVKGLRVRKEIASMTDQEVQRLREAIACMQTYNAHWQDERSFDYWARIHASSCQHGWEQFLPWHRLYLYFFEQMLQDFDNQITLPYWAWSDYADANRDTFNTQKLDQGILPERYGCWMTKAGVANLTATGLLTDKQLSGLEKLAKSGQVYNSSARFLKAAGVEYMLELDPTTGGAQWTPPIAAIYAELLRINPLWFPNRWPGVIGSPTSYPTADDIKLLLETPNWAEFGGGPLGDHHFGNLEQVHNGMHNFSGGTNPNYPGRADGKWTDLYKKLGIAQDPQNKDNPPYGWMVDNRITAFDPIFWAHHSNVDRLWAQWQTTHPNGNPQALDGVLAPWSLTVADTLSTRTLGYEYMRNSYHYPTSSEHGMQKFNSEKAGISNQTLDVFRKAQVRLHRVQRSNLPNASIRVYLNDSGCDASTKMDGNDHFVGEIQTFHGTCIGGPGHCDMPLDKTRQFDQRMLHHNEPRNYRIDATDAVNRMLADGAQDISVHLVAVGLDGQPVDDALYLDGVSLNFMD